MGEREFEWLQRNFIFEESVLESIEIHPLWDVKFTIAMTDLNTTRAFWAAHRIVPPHDKALERAELEKVFPGSRLRFSIHNVADLRLDRAKDHPEFLRFAPPSSEYPDAVNEAQTITSFSIEPNVFEIKGDAVATAKKLHRLVIDITSARLTAVFESLSVTASLAPRQKKD